MWIKKQLKRGWKWLVGIFVVGTLAFNLPPQGAVQTDFEIAEDCIKTSQINQCLTDLNGNEKATLKGKELAKIGTVVKQNVKSSGADYDIEVVSMNPIDGGVEVFARVWNPGGTQIGFGKDGTVDIERFVVINPPILVPDPNGDITRISEFGNYNLREDPKEAILQVLSHTVLVKKQKFNDSKIILNKIGNT